MSFIPYPDKIVVEPLVEENIIKTAGGSAYKHAGKVLSVGSSVTWVKPGDTVFFAPHAPWATSEVDGARHHVITDHSEFILGKIEYVPEKSLQG